jgi:septal ring factor EnvC (AmiA/AmiB activator)
LQERAEADKLKQAKEARRNLAQKEEECSRLEAELSASKARVDELYKDLKVEKGLATQPCYKHQKC